MRLVGIDPSLTALGLATPERVWAVKPPDRLRGPARLVYLRDATLEACQGAAIVTVEGYSHASRHAAHALGELGGVLRVALYETGVRSVDVAPSSRAKYATGDGGAGKDQVLAAAIRRLGYQGHDDNEADALWLRAMALDHYLGESVVPKAQRDALHALVTKKGPRKGQPVIDWPVLAETVSTGGRL